MLAGYIILGIVLYGGCMVGLYGQWQKVHAEERARKAARRGEVELEQLLEPHRIENATVRDEAAESGYLAAWDSLHGLAARMTRLAIASDELAQRCRARALEGGRPVRPLAEVDYYAQLPADLGHSAPRPGSPAAWQAVDRALTHLAAIHESNDAGVHADAHEQISIAARTLADELTVDGVQVDLDHCIFCQREAGEGVRVLYTPRAAICEDCVHEIDSTLNDL